MAADPDIPTIDELIADLRVLRERGLVRLRPPDLADLGRAARRAAPQAALAGGPGAVEDLLRTAVDNLGGGPLREAGTATLGLGRGARGRAGAGRPRRPSASAGARGTGRLRTAGAAPRCATG